MRGERDLMSRRWILPLIGSVGVILTMFNNCGIQRPAVTNSQFASIGYSHTGLETSCSVCHESARPQLNIGSHNFSHSSAQFGTTGDCIGCHSTNVGENWSGGVFPHSPYPTSCQTCHTNQRPALIVGPDTNPFDHSINGLGDCVSCHYQSTRFIDLGDWAPGESQPQGLIGNRAFNISVVTPSFNGTVMSKPPAQMKAYNLEVNHASLLVSGRACTDCHSGAATGTFAGGELHSKLLANPTSCAECHDSTDPFHVSAQPSGIVGSRGFMRHEAVSWTADSAGSYSRGPSAMLSQDCAVCHLSASSMPQAGQPLPTGPTYIPFSGANFHGNVAPASLTSCLDCHAGNRPSSAAGWVNPSWNTKSNIGAPPTTTFNLSQHALKVDCSVCHQAPSSSSTSAANWGSGNYLHSSLTSNCLNCHLYPAGVQSDGVTSFSHAGMVSNCVGCHAASTSAFPSPVMANWRGGKATPDYVVGEKILTRATTCQGVNGALPNCVASSPNKISLGMSHSAIASLPACTNCHGSGAPTATNGKFHTPPGGVSNWIAPTLPECSNCHDPSPVATGLTSIKSIKMVGSLTATGDAIDHGYTPVAALKCSDCHTAPTASTASTWNVATKLHVKLSAAQVTNCAACHYKRMPSGSIARKNQVAYKGTTGSVQKFIHNTGLISASAQECSSCHTDKGGSWTTAGKATFHKSLTVTNQCAVCHVAPVGLVSSSSGAGSFNHSGIGAQDCSGCHQTTLSKIVARVPAAIDWDGGVGRPHALTGSTVGATYDCAGCHGPSGSANLKLSVPVASHYNQATTCIGCHSDYIDFATKLKFAHTASTGTCNSCHNFSSGSYKSYTSVAKFNVSGTFTLSASTNVTGSSGGDSFTAPHSNTKMNLCSSCHKYTAPSTSTTNVWTFSHRPSNPGVTNSKSTNGCNMCH